MAEQQQLPTRMEFVGQTYSKHDVALQPRVSGYLTGIHYKEGSVVRKGDLLLTIDPQQTTVDLHRAEAALANARAVLVDAQNDYDRSVPLARISAISQSSLDKATANLAAARSSVRSASADLNRARLNQSYTKIYAPVDGVIGETRASLGDYVGTGTQIPVLNVLSQVDSIYVNVSLPLSRYLEIAARDSMEGAMHENHSLLSNIRMKLSDGTIYSYAGAYDFTQRAIDNAVGAVVLRVLFPNSDMSLKPGQYVRIMADVGRPNPVVLVPQKAVIQTQGNNSVYVVKSDSTLEFRPVGLGDTYGAQWVIGSGLAAGEQVLTEGFAKVRGGMKIIPVAAGPQEQGIATEQK